MSQIPSSIGPYQVLSQLGEGGMGVVYRGRDPRLDRDVAIKLLPELFANDPDRLARFEREAKTLASLNHPHIAQVYAIEGQAIVMELVEGEDLAERLKRGPIPLDEAIAIAQQIAEALEAAHDAGIIHRDLKPANIKVRPDGTVKVLDFGLAKAVEQGSGTRDQGSGGTANSPTITTPAMTLQGVILGTAAYMAPEQAKGKFVDRRADIWAFGAVLFEMLAGTRAFPGDDMTDTIVAVMSREPDWSALPRLTPAPILVLLRRCLNKDRRSRLDSAAAVRLDIDDARTPLRAAAAPPQPRSDGRMAWAIAAVAVVAALGLAAQHFTEVEPVPPLISTSVNAPAGTEFEFAGVSQSSSPELSPDGKWIVFSARTADNKRPLWLRPLASNEAQMLANTDGATFPFWSPDSRSIAFFHQGKLKTMAIAGGLATTLADAPVGRGGSWSNEGTILFIPGNGAILQIAATGGTPSAATVLGAKSGFHRSPWFLPDGRHFLFGDVGAIGGAEMVVRIGSLESFDTVEIGAASSNAVYANGYLLFMRDQTLVAQPFDPATLTVKGGAVTVAEGVQAVLQNGRKGLFTVSRTGMLAYQTGAAGRQLRLTWFDRAGKSLGTLGEVGDFRSVEFSPDGRSTAVGFVDATGNEDIWVYDNARTVRTRFSTALREDRQPIWSPDGTAVIWNYVGEQQLLRKNADGSGREEVLYKTQDQFNVGGPVPTNWSPDGKFLLFDQLTRNRGRGIWMLPLQAETPGKPRQPVAVIDQAFDESSGRLSSDGPWLAYVSTESRQREVYVAAFPGLGGRRQISASGGWHPRWRRDGKELFFVSLSDELMAAEITVRPSGLEVGQVRSLGIRVSTDGASPRFDVSPDGQRILAITGSSGDVAPLTLIQNWTGMLKK